MPMKMMEIVHMDITEAINCFKIKYINMLS